MNQGTIGSMRQLGVTESYKLKRQVVVSASEAAEMIIRYAVHLLDYDLSLNFGCEQGG
jgi:chaperonin GroEL (HSP60 family)